MNESVGQTSNREEPSSSESDMEGTSTRYSVNQLKAKSTTHSNVPRQYCPTRGEMLSKTQFNQRGAAIEHQFPPFADYYSRCKLELSKFRGDPLDYPAFIQQFEKLYPPNQYDELTRYIFLQQN